MLRTQRSGSIAIRESGSRENRIGFWHSGHTPSSDKPDKSYPH